MVLFVFLFFFKFLFLSQSDALYECFFFVATEDVKEGQCMYVTYVHLGRDNINDARSK